MQSENCVLSLRNISKSFPGVKALDDVSIDVNKGDIFILMGENGAGKSTLIKILTGVYPPDSGDIFIDGKKTTLRNTNDSRDLGIGTVFQENSLIGHLTVAENIFLTNEQKNAAGFINWRKMHSECLRWGADLGISIDPRARVKDLSVAQQQLVEVIKVFSKSPRIIVLDEPTSSLSSNEVDNLFKVILRMREKGITFIYISHRLEEFKRIGTRAAVLRDGKLVSTIENVKATDLEELIRLIVGRTLKEKYPSRKHNIEETIFEAKGLSVPGFIYDVNISVRKGEVVGLAGLVGSGRTTVAKAIFGACPGARGDIRMNGKAVMVRTPRDAVRAGIGFLPEDRKNEGIILSKSVAWNITLPSLKRFRRAGVILARREAAAVMDYIEKLSVKTPSIHRLARNLSGGNQQKVVFSKWLCAKSKLYIFDEPTRGIDVGAKTDIYEIINNLVAQGNGVLVISSELPEILGICDRIAVMHDGRVTGVLNRDEATQEKIMYYAIGGKENEQAL
jgi:ABC-type sugar transport system ATPase subunit